MFASIGNIAVLEPGDVASQLDMLAALERATASAAPVYTPRHRADVTADSYAAAC